MSLKRIFAQIVVTATLLVIGLPSQVFAEPYIALEDIHVTTPVYRPEASEFEPPLGTYSYTVSWQGIPAASATVMVAQSGFNYIVETKARTYSGIDILYKLRYRAEGTISAIDYFPVRTVFEQRENSRNRYTELKFLPTGEIEALRKDLAKNETKTLLFDPENFTLDPFSAAFLARGLKWEKGETKVFDTFNGKSRYLIKLHAEDKIQMRVNKQLRDVWVIVPSVQNLSYPKSNGKLRTAKIYVTADRNRDILKIVSSVFIGSVTTQLDSFIPSTDAPASTHVAARPSEKIFE